MCNKQLLEKVMYVQQCMLLKTVDACHNITICKKCIANNLINMGNILIVFNRVFKAVLN